MPFIVRLVERFYSLKEVVMQALGSKIPAFITPNALSMLRLVLVLPLIWALTARAMMLALLIFFFAVLLDLIDGPLARVRKTTSGLGILLDPLADKILMIVALFLLQFSFSPSPLPELVFFVVLIFEGVQLLLPVFHRIVTLQFHLRGPFPQANLFGKIKFALQSFGGLAMFLFPIHSTFGPIASAFFSVSVLFSVLSMSRQIIHAFKS